MKTIRIKAEASSKKQSITQISPGVFHISVKEPPKDNRANQKIMELLSDFIGIPRNKLRMIHGHHHESKLVEILGEKR